MDQEGDYTTGNNKKYLQLKHLELAQWFRNKMIAILQWAFSNMCSWEIIVLNKH